MRGRRTKQRTTSALQAHRRPERALVSHEQTGTKGASIGTLRSQAGPKPVSAVDARATPESAHEPHVEHGAQPRSASGLAAGTAAKRANWPLTSIRCRPARASTQAATDASAREIPAPDAMQWRLGQSTGALSNGPRSSSRSRSLGTASSSARVAGMRRSPRSLRSANRTAADAPPRGASTLHRRRTQ
jgi:hypothetical protein